MVRRAVPQVRPPAAADASAIGFTTSELCHLDTLPDTGQVADVVVKRPTTRFLDRARGHSSHYMSLAGRLELTLPPDPASVAEARSRVLDAVSPSLADGKAETLRLLVSEVVTNARRPGRAAAPLAVRATWNDEVVVEVTDHGEGFLPEARPRAREEPGGFGLFLVGQLADRWGVDSDEHTRVWFVISNAG